MVFTEDEPDLGYKPVKWTKHDEYSHSIRAAVEELLSTAGYERAAADPDEPFACAAYDSGSSLTRSGRRRGCRAP